ncbi:hypothetical protein BDV32DRAFT_120340 [Aspergillus pseudonomiae]|nr:hypothetical protein BDV32DRAFT_120340 [Aspergillus pseudonomiae]
MRILLSGWMQRLWTLEEAVLGRDRLCFQFLEGAVKLPSLISEQPAVFWELLGQTPFLSHEIGAVAMDRLPHLSKFELPDTFISEPPVAPFKPYEGPSPLYLLSGVQLRQTTKQEDQYLCSASLMRIDVRSIAQSDSTLDRARAFYTSLANRRIPVPAQILFSDEQKLPTDGFRWAPATLLSQSDNPLLLLDNVTGWYFGPDGLFCRYPGYYLSDLPKDLSNYECVVATYRQRVEIWEPVRPQFVDLTTSVNSSLVLRREEHSYPEHFALLLNQINDANSEHYFGSKSSKNLAVLAYIYRSEDTGVSQVLYARYIQAVRKMWPREDDSDGKLRDMTSVLQSRKSYHTGASYLKHSDWCIG